MYNDSHLRLICKKGLLSRVVSRAGIQLGDFIERPKQTNAEDKCESTQGLAGRITR